MTVWEIKEPLGQTPAQPKPRKREVVPVTPVSTVRAVDRLFLRRDWNRNHAKGHERPVSRSQAASIREIRLLVQRLNDNLSACGIMIHLVIARNGDDWGLDIYDCTDGVECRIIHNMAIDFDALSGLLASLQQEVGLMMDRVL
ncbi:MAG TPA: hypothetical protein ENK33_08475 [Desulfobacterales bacterium]|nr:hypothetical protein [Desulfobacterales bacterium]